jgi:prepilin-type N-terminal cleavage/methylation domain-containing protein
MPVQKRLSLSGPLPPAGFTLIEVIVSLLIVSVALAALAPALALAAYRRVLAGRIEVGSQLAQSEVDRIRALVDQCGLDGCPFEVEDLPPDGADFGTAHGGIAAPLGVPTTALGIPELQGSSSVKKLEAVGSGLLTGSGEEFVVQTYRNTGSPCVNDRNEILEDADGDALPCSFILGVRVYHIRSFDNSGVAFPDMDNYLAPVTSFSSFQDQGTRLRPLAVLQANISQSASLGDICRSVAANPNTECDWAPSPLPAP